MYDRLWDEYTLMARGLIIDTEANKIVATPFPKFFNHGERSEKLPDEPFDVYEKLDGSLGIAFWHDERWQITTKGTFGAEQAALGQEMLNALDLGGLRKGYTYLFEIIGPWNQIVVPYEKSELVLLSVYADTGEEIPTLYPELTEKLLGLRCAKKYEGHSLEDLLAIAKTLPRTDEGFVVRFKSGLRVKIKGDAYVRAHKLASKVTPIGVWEAMLNRDNLDELRREIPEELWADFDRISALLHDKVIEYLNIWDAVNDRFKDATNKEVGLANPPHAWMVFAHKQGKFLYEDPKLRHTVFGLFRPTGNVLEGYTPSRSVNRFKEA